MNTLLWSIGATVVVSFISLIGIAALMIKKRILERILLWLVGFSAGALIGGAFLHLIPEALSGSSQENVFVYVLVGFSSFFVLERFIKWRHCHNQDGKCEIHSFTYMNLIGDGFHNFIDGLIIVASFSINPGLGIATTLAVIAHEIPQEISDFGVLVYGGFSRARALVLNFLIALTAILGALVGFFLLSIQDISQFLLSFTAGSFIYISASDLIPELHKEPKVKKSVISFSFFLLGALFMYLVRLIFE